MTMMGSPVATTASSAAAPAAPSRSPAPSTPLDPPVDDDDDDDEDDDEGAATNCDADADDDDDEPPSWKKLGLSKLLGRKKAVRQKKYRKAGGGGGGGGGGAGGEAQAEGSDDRGDLDSSACDGGSAAGPEGGGGTPKDAGGNGNGKPRRPARQRAKVAMHPAKKALDNSESGVSDAGSDPREVTLPQRRRVGGNRHHGHAPPRPQPYRQQRRKKKGRGGDGYENSGHETSDFMFTEDDKSDFYLVTEDDRDGDDDEKRRVDANDLEALYAATQKLTLETPPDADAKVDPPPNVGKTSAAPDERPPPDPTLASPAAETKPKKKRSPRRRTPKGKVGPQTVPEAGAVQEEEHQQVQHHQKQQKQKQKQQQQQQQPQQQKQRQTKDKDNDGTNGSDGNGDSNGLDALNKPPNAGNEDPNERHGNKPAPSVNTPAKNQQRPPPTPALKSTQKGKPRKRTPKAKKAPQVTPDAAQQTQQTEKESGEESDTKGDEEADDVVKDCDATRSDGSSKSQGDEKPGLPDEKPTQSQTQPQQESPGPTSQKEQMPRKQQQRTPKTKRAPRATPATGEDEDTATSMQEEEELDCHTPAKATLRQQQQQQTPKRRRHQRRTKKSPNPQEVIHEREFEHEDEDDYPADLVTPVKEGGGKEGHGSPKEFVEKEMTFLKKKEHPAKRSIEEELAFLKRISSTRYQVQLGFVPNMKVPAEIIVNNDLQTLLVQELRDSCCGPKASAGSFIPALRQAANVAALPGIVKASLAMPDVHSGYGFCIGNVAAFDMDDPAAVISPGGVGFDINCGVRLIRTNLTEDDVGESMREKLADTMFRNIPVGVGAGGDIPCSMAELDRLLSEGIDWAIRKGFAWKEDKDHCEEYGRMETADPKCVSHRAKKRGLKQLGTLGAGNHYAEIQVVDEIYHPEAAKVMGVDKVGQVCVMIHTGSRGLGHQVATDALTVMERAMARDHIDLNDRQLSCARINSKEGEEYLAAMSSAANFAWVNRSCITFLTRKAFSEVFNREADDMDMHLVYDVCHNIAKVETHVVNGVTKKLLVHRKGSTRAFPPKHPNLPKDYQAIGQPVLIGGTMGTCSYVLVGTDKGMKETFGSTCHGAGRALSRNQSRKKLNHEEVLGRLREKGISIRVASPKLVTEEAPESYKDVCDVIETCQDAGISNKVVKLRPIAVIKG